MTFTGDFDGWDPEPPGARRLGESEVWLQEETFPRTDATYRTSPRREDRGILGTSLGGLNSAYFAVQAPETFGRIAIQSPAMQVGGGAILDLYDQAPRPDSEFFLSWGTFRDFGETTLRFRKIVDAKGYRYRQLTVDEGHSWGAWRAQLDDVLLAFWPAAER